MKSIIRNCLHYNDIFLARESDRDGIPKFIIKSSSSEIGINAIKNEVNGIEWYNNQGVDKLSILVELWIFIKPRKKWWLTPIIIFLVLFGALIVLTEGSVIAPFIYALF